MSARSFLCYNIDMIKRFPYKYISDPSDFLQKFLPDLSFRKTAECSIDDSRVPAYEIMEYNGCAVNASAAMISFASGNELSFKESLAGCLGIAGRGYSRKSGNEINYYIKLGQTARFLNDSAKLFGINKRARSSLRVFRTAVNEIASGRAVFLNIGLSRQYFDHTIVAYGFEEYVAKENGRRYVFFKVRDGYSKEIRYFLYSGILGIYITYFR